MKRILFVDDEPMVLEGLQRMLRSMRGEWEMEFLDSGAKALLRMWQCPFDAIVSDMHMPNMNGADLLNEVMMHFPQTVRLVLSGHADQDLILKCVGATHQYLSKPCDAEMLKSIIQRASSVESSLHNERIQKLVARMDRLPTIPTLYTQILESVRNPYTTIEEVGDIIGRDIGMTTKILKLVNSGFFGLGWKISSPAEAANYLGLDLIRSLVLSVNAFSQFDSMPIESFSLESLLNHSLQTAAAAKTIALEETADRSLADQSFIAGMLHDVGKIVLAANFPKECATAFQFAARGGVTFAAAEKEIFGADHASIGGYLLGLWGLPPPVVEAIAFHHHPNLNSKKTFTPLAAVHVANVFVHDQASQPCAFRVSPIDGNYLEELSLSDHIDSWRAAAQNPLSTGILA